VIARRWVVSGTVQGVGFRWYVRNQALALGVGGWALNLPDGSVEVVGVATAGTIEAFEALVRQGPPAAAVTGVAAEDIPHERVDSKSFIIKR